MSYVSTPFEEERSTHRSADAGGISDALRLDDATRLAAGLEEWSREARELRHRVGRGMSVLPQTGPLAGELLSLRPVDRLCRQLILQRLNHHFDEPFFFEDREGQHWVNPERQVAAEQASSIRVRHPRAYRMFALGGSLWGSEAYLLGDWGSPDLVRAMRVLSRHSQTLARMERGPAKLLRPLRVAANWLRRNSRLGSRRNIAAHYDLSNDFFELMLDRTMTYSAGIFRQPSDSLEQASSEKYDRICRKLHLTPADHVLEIGCGWGGFAIHAAQQYGCRVTATTISQAQYDFAARRIAQTGLQSQIKLVLKDYRDLTGSFDKAVSIEMIEAVGEQYLDGYFRQCSRLLKPTGMMLLQAIMIPDDRYDYYRSSVDFIRRFVFPGGFLPALCAISSSLRRCTDFRVAACDDFGLHYAETLARWRQNFWQHIDRVRELGFDERFIRTWDYYLCYCEAGFEERQIGVSHLLLLKPGCRDQQAGIPFPG